ncbi:MAG: dipeptide epimerase [Verrucomicrobiales bacterium]|nr:dipeptide epimerase [Verrucomicrobiales bacterium]
MKLILHEVALPMRRIFRIAHGQTTVQTNLLVELRDEAFAGYGEGAPLDYYGITARSMRDTLESARDQIESVAWTRPEELWDQMLPSLGDNRFALCALDEAAYDLWGKKRGEPVYKLLGLKLDRIPFSNYTVGIDTVENMVANLKEFPDWPIYKIKLGTPDDLRIVRELRRHTAAIFRVDANCAWTTRQTIKNGPELKSLGVELIEQPLPADDWDGMKRLYAESGLPPIIADESCLVEEDVERCHGFFHGINIKLTKAGGLTPARRMIDHAHALGMEVMVGCMYETSVGISAIAQLLPLLEYVDMDGAHLLAKDIATGVRVERGRAIFPNENGNGVQLLPFEERVECSH